MIRKMSSLLDQIKKPNDIKKINPADYEALADEIRTYIVNSVSKTGGHLASNLGVIELTIALHLCMDLPKDKIIWDVGHQSYTHKILTGRLGEFKDMRSFGGMSGFPKRRESECDAFDTGHSSTSISAALGYTCAREVTGDDYFVTAVIGDGSMTGGMAYEALNNAAKLKSNMIIILNDNNMSISENVGGMNAYLNNIRTSENYYEFKSEVETALRSIPGLGDTMAKGIKQQKDKLKHKLIDGGFFEALGLEYIGPVDGHDIGKLCRAIQTAKRYDKTVLLHVVTKKGRGYKPAEQDPMNFHGVGKFDIATGRIVKSDVMSWTEVFSRSMIKIGEKHKQVVAITAAMAPGTGLLKFSKRYPKRFFDVGIAEQHAVTFAGGLAAAGLKPYVAIYSSFFQRAYDQIVHDVCIPDLPVTFCIDRAGIVGADGETHQGILDLSFFSSIPGMTLMAPKNAYEFKDMMQFSVEFKHPLAIRYPRGDAWFGMKEHRAPIKYGRSELLYQGSQIALIAIGNMVQTACEARDILKKQGIDVTVVNGRFIKPLDIKMLDQLEKEHDFIITLEENVIRGGFGEAVADYYMTKKSNVVVNHVGIPDVYVEHGKVNELQNAFGMDADAVVMLVKSKISKER